jgi:hypothetical protein
MSTRRGRLRSVRAVAVLLAASSGLLLAACATTQRPPVVVGVSVPSTDEGSPTPTPAVTPEATPYPMPSPAAESREVVRFDGDAVLNVWTEPRRLPLGGGQAQVIVRVLRRNGRPLPGVEVRITSSGGALFSQGRILTTDDRGMVRDSLTVSQPTTITVDAGGRARRVELLLGETVLDD